MFKKDKKVQGMIEPQLIINHVGHVALQEKFHIVEWIDQGFWVVEVNKLVVNMTT
jgi:hypothetical protein